MFEQLPTVLTTHSCTSVLMPLLPLSKGRKLAISEEARQVVEAELAELKKQTQGRVSVDSLVSAGEVPL